MEGAGYSARPPVRRGARSAAAARRDPAPTLAAVFPFLLIVFLVTPIVELYLIVQVAGEVGVLNTIALLVLISAVGAWLVKREGLGILRKAEAEMAAGRIPGRQLVDGLLVLFGGALMLTPGFATDALGLSLLFPPTRMLLRASTARWFGRRMERGRHTMAWRVDLGGHRHGGFHGTGDDPIDVESWRDDEPPKRPELG